MKVARVTVSATTQWLTGALILVLLRRGRRGIRSSWLRRPLVVLVPIRRPGARRAGADVGGPQPAIGVQPLPRAGPVGRSLIRTCGTTDSPTKSGVSSGLASASSIRTGRRWVTFT